MMASDDGVAVFERRSVRALRIIKYCALTTASFWSEQKFTFASLYAARTMLPAEL